MIETLQQPGLQLRTLRLYGELLCRRSEWAGRLVIAAFTGASGSGLAAAASLAGAASITVESDANAMKAHFRDGAFDFVVNTLDEALRAIKNELRKGRPIAIGLIAEPAGVLQEAAERGVAAALVLCAGAEVSPLEMAVGEAGAALIGAGGVDQSTPELQSWLFECQWCVTEIVFAEALIKQRLIETPGHRENVKARWLKNLPAHQRSARSVNVWTWLSPKETRDVDKPTASPR